MSVQTTPCIFMPVRDMRFPPFTKFMLDVDQTIIITNRGIANAIIRPFKEDEERRYLEDLDLFTVSIRDVRHWYEKTRQVIKKGGGGQAGITRVPPGRRHDELLKLITLLDPKQGAQLSNQLYVDQDVLSEFTKFRA